MHQTNLAPILCSRIAPAPQSADADFVAICEQSSKKYLCKSQKKLDSLPAIEWICSSLARDCGLPVPHFEIVETTIYPGMLMFGSEWIDDCVDFTRAFSEIKNHHVLNEALELDFFAHNSDRHLGNYLYSPTNGGYEISLIDFSRALLYHGWPLPPLPLASSDNTIVYFNRWRATYGYMKTLNIANKIKEMRQDWMFDTMTQMPSIWLNNGIRQELANWWACVNKHENRISRVEMIELTLP